MIALSVRGPWWWFILHAGKPVENRTWRGQYKAMQMAVLARNAGKSLLHASSGCTVNEYEEACELAVDCGVTRFPSFETMERGGLVGRLNISGWIEVSDSPWFGGDGALAIERAEPIAFVPFKGALGFFTVPPREYPTISAVPIAVSDWAATMKRKQSANRSGGKLQPENITQWILPMDFPETQI